MDWPGLSGIVSREKANLSKSVPSISSSINNKSNNNNSSSSNNNNNNPNQMRPGYSDEVRREEHKKLLEYDQQTALLKKQADELFNSHVRIPLILPPNF